jgi:hypothetical protein
VSEFRPVPGYAGYSVSDDGAIRGPRGALRPMARATGHLFVLPYRRGRLYVHVAVLTAFVGPRPVGQEARHLNGVSSDNRLTNLAWGTRLQNAADRQLHGDEPHGDAKPNARLTSAQALAIRDDTRPSREVGAAYGVSHTAVLRIRRGEKWRALGGR